jgi:hypothetical protein
MSSRKNKGFLYYIYCALGEKSHPNCNKTADKVALIRLLITVQILITNFFIIYGILRTHHFTNHQSCSSKIESR